MARFSPARWFLPIFGVACLVGSGPAEAAGCCPSQTTCVTNPNPSTCTITAPATGCLNQIRKGFFPSYLGPTGTVYVFKYMATAQNCGLVTGMNAFCNPAAASSPGATKVDASAFGAQITMNPSCSWNCLGACGSITTTAAGDGLPVELMEFGFEGDEEPEAAAGGEASAGD